MALLAAIAPKAGFATTNPAKDLKVWLAREVPSGSPAKSPNTSASRLLGHTKYLKSSEVDQRATPLEIPPLLYPEKAYINRLRGSVRLRIYISEGGKVDRVDVVAATPPGHFEQAAIDAVQRTRFQPALRAGRPVRSEKLIEVEFDPYGPTPEERP